MKALSILQPWAWLIVHGPKDVENRTWSTPFRGEFLVHAGKGFDRKGYYFVRQTRPDIRMPAPHEFQRGGVIARSEQRGEFGFELLHAARQFAFGGLKQQGIVDDGRQFAVHFLQDIADALVGGGQGFGLRQGEEGIDRLGAALEIQRAQRTGGEHGIEDIVTNAAILNVGA